MLVYARYLLNEDQENIDLSFIFSMKDILYLIEFSETFHIHFCFI